MEKICVAVRVRPTLNEESVDEFHWKVESNRISLHRSHGTPISGVSFAFDHVFDQECSNARIYELLTKDIISAAVDGFNGTAFAYGQTSSGKTFTMNGSENDPGIIHRAVKDIFVKIQKTSFRDFLIRVSYMEIYNEDINDLFDVENQKLQIHESLERGVFVAGLREEIVNSADQVLNLIQLGEGLTLNQSINDRHLSANRHFGDTNMNVRSSRSHTIFRMVIESKAKDNKFRDSSCSDDAIRVSVLNLVDLAGSERVAKTGAGGVRLKEGKHINKSLMILGNVINKLSEGGKQRGHIPYRDSKLTRILQPALGGNAKTSIICTLAPEEVHIEETKGTLQFATRAKRITNCVQVNEILTDAALLKRQKLEIEELRRKLQGSHADVLEQQILRLRNDMLKYELEREKLAAELEEERRSHKERDRCIQEQQKKIDNLRNLVTLSDFDRSSSHDGGKECLLDGSTDSNSMRQEDAFSTPCYKAAPNVFVAKRSDYLRQPECSSPLPGIFGDFADEYTWTKMNKGFVPDLDSLHMTPARKIQSFPISEDCSMENCSQEKQNLQRQLKLITDERDELRRKHTTEVLFNNQLTREISEFHQEILLIRQIPQNLHEAVGSCKDIYRDVFSIFQNFVMDERSANAQILSTISEVGKCLFSTLESHLVMAMDGERPSPLSDSSIRDQCNILLQTLSGVISSLVLSDQSTLTDDDKVSDCSSKIKGNLGGQIACWKQELEYDAKMMKQKYSDLEKELEVSNQLLKVSDGKNRSLERELYLLKEDRDAVLKKICSSSQLLEQTTGQKEKALEDLNNEVRRRKKLEEEIKQFHIAFACRQRSIMSFHSEFKSILEVMKSQNPTLLSK